MEWLNQMSNVQISNTIPQGGTWDEVDGPTLLAAASSLQLIAENAHFLTRLQRLAAAAARLPERPQARRLSSSAVKKLLADPFVSGPDIVCQEDPYEGIYVAEVPYTGGPRLVIEGISEGEGARIASALLAAVMGAPKGTFPDKFVTRVNALAVFLLSLSNSVARTADLKRGTMTLTAGRAVSVPSAQRLAELSQIVKFEEAELWTGLPTWAREYLKNKLVRDVSEVPQWREGATIDEEIILRPLVRSGSCVTLASPGHLLAALRHHIICESLESECSATLADALRDATAFEAGRLLEAISDEPLTFAKSGEGYLRSTTKFDQDKTLDVICLVDDLSEYNPSAIFQQWRALALSARIHGEFSATDATPEKTLRVVAYQGVGRDIVFGIPETESPEPTLFLPIEDLEVILQSPGTDKMTLWYFALARQQFERKAQVLAFSSVDVFALYRDHEDSFYMGDDARPTLINVEPGYGQKLRVDNYRSVDKHWLIDPTSRVLCEAFALYGQSSPVYLVLGRSQASMVVEVEEHSVWVRLTKSKEHDSNAEATYDFGQAVAFWLWQLLSSHPMLRGSARTDILEVEVATRLSGARTPQGQDDEERWISAHVEEPGRMTLTLGTPPLPNVSDPENYLDRQLVEALLAALAPDESKGSDCDNLLEELAPAGPKRMIHVYDAAADVTASPGNLPEARRVQSAAVARVLDDLGTFLTDQQGLTAGPFDKDHRTNFLNDKVTRWLIDQLDDQARALSSDGLLEKLVTLDEALTSETARQPQQLRARLACFGVGDNQVQKLQKQQTNAVASSLASRFLIEYVTAISPAGTQPLTNETYDHMIALSSEIINKGMLSDAIRHNLSDAQISILASSRLGISRDDDKYHHALTSFGASLAQLSFEAAVTELKEAASQDFHTIADADALAEIEFGFSFTNLAEACVQVIELADKDGFSDVLRIQTSDVRDKLRTDVGWSDNKIETLLGALTLPARAASAKEYWEGGPQVFPWRFNRELSYLRRPLLEVAGQEPRQIVAGRRRLWQTASYWLEQFTTGRLQGKTKPMKAALNKIRSAKGDSFELTVARCLEAAGLSGVRSRLSRVGHYDFRNIAGANLGDIDAIGVDERRKRIYVVEAKDFEVARTPAELSNEIDNLLLSDKAAAKRLSLRTDWVRNHVAPTLAELGVKANKGSWTVTPLIVVDERLLSARLSTAEIPIVSISELEAYLDAANGDGARLRRSPRQRKSAES